MSLEELSTEGCGSEWAILPVMIMKIWAVEFDYLSKRIQVTKDNMWELKHYGKEWLLLLRQ
jgi:hypothetical protein